MNTLGLPDSDDALCDVAALRAIAAAPAKIDRVGGGIQNVGNTCFMNALLQCLTFVCEFLDADHPICVCHEFCRIERRADKSSLLWLAGMLLSLWLSSQTAFIAKGVLPEKNARGPASASFASLSLFFRAFESDTEKPCVQRKLCRCCA